MIGGCSLEGENIEIWRDTDTKIEIITRSLLEPPPVCLRSEASSETTATRTDSSNQQKKTEPHLEFTVNREDRNTFNRSNLSPERERYLKNLSIAPEAEWTCSKHVEIFIKIEGSDGKIRLYTDVTSSCTETPHDGVIKGIDKFLQLIALQKIDNSRFARDDMSNYYYDNNILEGTVEGVFTVIAKNEGISTSYAMDEKSVWYSEMIIPNADPDSFQLLSSHYSKDASSVFYLEKSIIGADPHSFQVANDIAKDNTNIFVNEQILEGAKADSYQKLGSGYAKDSEQVWYGNKVISGADSNSFGVIKGGYAKDSEQVWYNGILITGADPSSFEFINCGPEPVLMLCLPPPTWNEACYAKDFANNYMNHEIRTQN